MPIPLGLLRQIQSAPPADAWRAMLVHVWEICSQPLETKGAAAAVTSRDREVAALDLFLTAAGWDLWEAFDECVEHTADALASWWQEQTGGRAVLILDALSMREAPWIFQGAAERGYKVSGRVTFAELPADTTQFARALGFAQRSALSNNGAGNSHRLDGARTESVDLPWADCASMIKAEPRWALWHHWPDSRLHDFAVAGQGVNALTEDAVAKLTSDDFWLLIERLTTGRSLVITSDHGYAATGLFPDSSNEQQAKFLRDVFRSGRWTQVDLPLQVSHALPPLDLTLSSRQGQHRFVLGRRKWKSQGGYPTLAHGGLSLLEVAVPFIELSR